jgi:hypothetical protein
MRVARAYGFSKAIHINEYARRHMELNPLTTIDSFNVHCTDQPDPDCKLESRKDWEKVAGIIAMSEPNHLAQTFQIVVDLLLSPQPGLQELSPEQIPIIFANMDVLTHTMVAVWTHNGGV